MPAPQIWNADRTAQVSSVSLGSIAASSASGEQTMWIYNDKGELLAADLLAGIILSAEDELGATSGVTEIDGAWLKVKITGVVDDTADPTMEAQATGFLSLGAFQSVSVLDIPAGCGRQVIVKVSVPGGVNEALRDVVLRLTYAETDSSLLWPRSFFIQLKYDGPLSEFAGVAWGVVPYDSWLVGARATVREGATGGAVDRETVIDVNGEAGTSVLSAPLAIVGTNTASALASYPSQVRSFDEGDRVTVDVDTIEAATTYPADLIVTLQFVRR